MFGRAKLHNITETADSKRKNERDHIQCVRMVQRTSRNVVKKVLSTVKKKCCIHRFVAKLAIFIKETAEYIVNRQYLCIGKKWLCQSFLFESASLARTTLC
jgi:hypothetical protein